MPMEVQDDGQVKFTLVRGDSADIVVTVNDLVTALPVDLSKATDGTVNRKAIIRCSVKDDPDSESNDESLLFKTSYVLEQIQALAQSGGTLGQCRIRLDKADTEDADPSVKYRWDVEVSRQDVLRPGASSGTVAVTTGGLTLMGSGTQFQNARQFDIINFLGGVNDGAVCMIVKIVSATQVLVDNPALGVDPTAAFEVRRGFHNTTVRGPFLILSGVVAQ